MINLLPYIICFQLQFLNSEFKSVPVDMGIQGIQAVVKIKLKDEGQQSIEPQKKVK